MRKAIVWRFCFGLIPVVLLWGCSLFDDDDCEDIARLKVAISASASLTSSSDPVDITVRAENQGNSRVVWGYGSSSCQLHAFVRIGENDYVTLDPRKCTGDAVEQWLDPGESRAEGWTWVGEVWKDQEVEVLPPGRYAVYGGAGSWVSTSTVRIEVLAP